MASSEVRIDPFQNHELISAYSEFAWPIVTLIFFFVILFRFGNELKILFRRIRKAKIAGSEIELEELKQNALELSKIDIVEEAKPKIEDLQATGGSKEENLSTLLSNIQSGLYPRPIRSNVIDNLNELTESDPLGAIVIAYNELARELETLALTKGLIGTQEISRTRFRPLVDIVSKNYDLPNLFSSACLQFQLQRNQIAHETYASDYNQRDAVDIAEAGIELLTFALRIQRPIFFVGETNIPLFTDETLKSRLTEFVGLELIIAATPGSTGSRIVAPVSPDLEFISGSQVSSVWGHWVNETEAWAQGPENAEKVWSSSARTFEGHQITG